MSEPIRDIETAVEQLGALPMPVGPEPQMPSEQRAAVAELIGDVKPATARLVEQLAQSIRDRREHEHPTWEDLYCLNLTSWMGERMGPVLRRLLDAEERVERRRARLAAAEADLLNVRGLLSPSGGSRRVPAEVEIHERVAPAVEWLLNRVAELEAAQGTVFRASHDSIVMGLYTSAAEARKHCETEMRREYDETTKVSLWWREDEDTVDQPEDGEQELYVHATPAGMSPGRTWRSGYVVTPLEVAAAYDEEADE
jgi:hypothetical protein